ncbi:MAG: DUF4082 domain-containing protein [Saprospiraceae bacterium]|nr:DUF4082 domain-containing protein [Saprospiraceae bacterium]
MGAIEVGLNSVHKYRLISAVRFYKNWAGMESFTVNLYSYPGGVLQGSGNASNGGTGWVQISLSTPVSITAGTTYVASVLTPSGAYAYTVGYFQTSDYNNPPLRALQTGEDGPNGVYQYGGGYPTSSFNGTNYWVDPVLSSPIPPAVVSAPDVCGVSPVISVTSTVTPGNCPNAYTLTRTWTATDNCGRTSQSQTVEVLPARGFIHKPCLVITSMLCSAAPPVATSLSYSNGQSGACEISGSVASSISEITTNVVVIRRVGLIRTYAVVLFLILV